MPSKGAYTQMRIKLAAIRLFNEQGIEAVSLRDIATALDVAYGNLTYYYSTKKALVFALYRDLRDEFESILSEVPKTDDPLGLFYEFPKTIAPLLFRYRFVLFDFGPTFRMSAGARIDFRQGILRLQKVVLTLLDALVVDGCIDRSPDSPPLEELTSGLELSLFSFSMAEVSGQDAVSLFIQQFHHQVFLLLNTKGQAAWKELGSA